MIRFRIILIDDDFQEHDLAIIDPNVGFDAIVEGKKISIDIKVNQAQ